MTQPNETQLRVLSSSMEAYATSSEDDPVFPNWFAARRLKDGDAREVQRVSAPIARFDLDFQAALLRNLECL